LATKPPEPFLTRTWDYITETQLWRSIFRHGMPSTNRNRVLVVMTNVFLHLHPVKIRKSGIRLKFTWCMGGLTFFLFLVETFTGGQIAARLVPHLAAEKIVRRAVASRDLAEVYAGVGLEGAPPAGELTRETAEAVAVAARRSTGATHALAVLIDLDDGPDRIDFGGTICLAIATVEGAESRRSRILGGREWVRLGACEMGLDCLRRHLQGLPVYERIDFEKT